MAESTAACSAVACRRPSRTITAPLPTMVVTRSAVRSSGVRRSIGREQLIPHWPDDLAADLATVNDDLAQAVRRFAHRRYGHASRAHLQATTFALLDLPAAAIRRYLLAGRPPPASLDPVVLAAARGALDAGGGPVQ